MSIKKVPASFALRLTEDWAVVVIGFLLIGLSIFGLSIASPTYRWTDFGEITNILSLANISRIVQQFVLMYLLVILGNALIGKPIINAIKSFPLVFLLTIIALFISGNSFLKDMGLEAVIFSLLIGLFVGNFFTLPTWFKHALNAELFVKIGLVLLEIGRAHV